MVVHTRRAPPSWRSLVALLTVASAAADSREELLSALVPSGPRPLGCTRDHTRGAKLRLFVYKLPWAYSGQIVEYVESQARKLLGVKCAYLREDTCPNTGFSHLENLRSHCTDVPILYKLLQTARLVEEAESADVFLVPFLMGCNAMLGWGHGMQRVNSAAHHAFFGNFPKFAREHLPHFARYPHRHLFLFPLDSMFAPKWLKHSMVAHTGAGYIGTASIDVPVPRLPPPRSRAVVRTACAVLHHRASLPALAPVPLLFVVHPSRRISLAPRRRRCRTLSRCPSCRRRVRRSAKTLSS